MFISRLRDQSERPQRAARRRLPEADHRAAGAVDGAQPLSWKGFKGLAVAEARLLRGVELDSRQSAQESPQGKKVSCSLRRQLLQRVRVLDAPAARAGASQGCQMRAGSQGFAEVLGQGAHVGALAAADTNFQQWQPDPDDFQFLDADRKSTRLNSSHGYISYAVFCFKKN